MKKIPPLDHLAYTRCLSECLHISYLDDLQELKCLVYGCSQEKERRMITLTKEMFQQCLLPLIMWECLFSETVVTMKKRIKSGDVVGGAVGETIGGTMGETSGGTIKDSGAESAGYSGGGA